MASAFWYGADMDEFDEVERINAVDPEHGIRVLRERCATCIFRPGNPLGLMPGRLREVVVDALKADRAVICHDTYDRAEQAVCRGFFDRYDTTPLRLARRLGMVAEIKPPTDGLKPINQPNIKTTPQNN